jgi:hypothetical protein
MTDYAFLEEHFPASDFPEFPDLFCGLTNENLFPVEKLIFLQKVEPDSRAAWMKALEPALGLIAPIILEKPEFYALFLKRNGSQEYYVDDDDEIAISREESIVN